MACHSSINRVVVLLCFLLCAVCGQAVKVSDEGNFVRCDAAMGVQPGYYVLASKVGETTVCLTNKPVNQKKKLQAKSISSADTIECPGLDCVWELREQNGSFVLVSAETGETIQRAGTNDLNLTSKLTSSDVQQFCISEQNGLSVLGDGEGYALRFDQGYQRFGMFKSGVDQGYFDLTLYRYVCNSAELSASQLRAVPARFVFQYGNDAVGKSGEGELTLVNAKPYKLSCGKVASDVPALLLHLNGTRLNDADGKELDSENAGQWMLYGNYLVRQSETDTTILTYSVQAGKFSFESVLAVDGLTKIAMQLTEVEADGTSEYMGNTLKLAGGWSQPALNSLSLNEGVTGLDLMATQLPDKLPVLDVVETNCVVYVSPKDADKIAAEQINAVAVAGGKGLLVRNMVLTDRKDFAFDYDIEIDANHSVVYQRVMPDNEWQTLFLPFTPDATGFGLTFAAVKGVTDENVLIEDTKSVTANVPVLFKYGGQPGGVVTFKGSNQTIMSKTASSDAVFKGLRSVLNVTDESVCVLADDGKRFCPALPGSSIDAFRAVLNMDSSSPMRIVEMVETGVKQVMNGSSCNGTACDVFGRLLAGKHFGWSAVPYVYGNKKIITK